MKDRCLNRVDALLCTMAISISALLPLQAGHAQTPPRSAGTIAWAQCSACHALKAGAPNKVGPNLFGIFGKPAGKVINYNYSPAMKAANIVWNDKMLDLWLTRPSAVIKGNKMAFSGISDAKRRKVLIEYIKHSGK